MDEGESFQIDRAGSQHEPCSVFIGWRLSRECAWGYMRATQDVDQINSGGITDYEPIQS
jgi:hypothetical protein